MPEHSGASVLLCNGALAFWRSGAPMLWCSYAPMLWCAYALSDIIGIGIVALLLYPHHKIFPHFLAFKQIIWLFFSKRVVSISFLYEQK